MQEQNVGQKLRHDFRSSVLLQNADDLALVET